MSDPTGSGSEGAGPNGPESARSGPDGAAHGDGRPRRRLRPWLLAALAAAIIVVAGQQLWLRRGEPAFPGVARASDVARIEMARGREQVVLARRADTGAWAVLSAADAPGNEQRIAGTIAALADLRGTVAADGGARPSIEPMEIRLSDADGKVLGHARLRPGVVERVDDGVAVAVTALPALPLWQSAWADLAPPRIAPDEIIAVHRLGPDGRVAMAPQDAAAVGEMLGRLSAQGFVAAATAPWAGARMVQLTLADGALVDVQQVPAGEGMFLVRMTSDKRTDVRLAREWAFRTTRALP